MSTKYTIEQTKYKLIETKKKIKDKNDKKLYEELNEFLYNIVKSGISKDIEKLTEIFFMIFYKSYSSETKTYNFKFKPKINYFLNDEYLIIKENTKLLYRIDLKKIIEDENKSNEILKWFNVNIDELLK